MTVSVDGVCRRKLSEKYNALLDRVTHETHPEYVPPEAPKGYEFDSDGNLVNTAERLQKEKEQTLSKVIGGMKEPGKGGKKKGSEFEEGVMTGNSKLLQGLSGALPDKGGKTSQPKGKK